MSASIAQGPAAIRAKRARVRADPDGATVRDHDVHLKLPHPLRLRARNPIGSIELADRLS